MSDNIDETKYLRTESGLQYRDLEVGDRDQIKRGQTVHLHTVGTLADGKEFDNSYKGDSQ